jgi:hypothetical protein
MKYEEYAKGNKYAQIVLLGPGRAGKTVTAYSVSHLGKTLGIESEEGVHAAERYLKQENLEIELVTKRVKDPKTGHMIPCLPENEMPIKKRLDEIVEIAFSSKWDFVVVDSLTEIAGRFEDQYARKATITQQDWGRIISGMQDFVRTMKRGSFHLIMTCIAAPPREGSLIDISPSLPGKLRETLLPMFQSICLVTYDKKTKKRLLVVNDPARGLCDRFHSFGQDVNAVDITDNPRSGIEGLIMGAMGAPMENEVATNDLVEEQVEAPDQLPQLDTVEPPKVKKARRAKRVSV